MNAANCTDVQEAYTFKKHFILNREQLIIGVYEGLFQQGHYDLGKSELYYLWGSQQLFYQVSNIATSGRFTTSESMALLRIALLGLFAPDSQQPQIASMEPVYIWLEVPGYSKGGVDPDLKRSTKRLTFPIGVVWAMV